MGSWWENERSLLAARVRSFRRRLRASYRDSARRAKAAAWSDLAARREIAEQAFDEAADAAKRFTEITITRRDYNLAHTLHVEVTIANELIMRADRHALWAAVGQHIARGIEREWQRQGPDTMDNGRWRRPKMAPAFDVREASA